MPAHCHLLRRHSARWLRGTIGVVGRLELSVLIAAGLIALGLWGFIELAGEVVEGNTKAFDERILRWFRRADDPSIPIGPAWLPEAARDVTALGANLVLALVTGAVAGFTLLHRRYGALVLVVLTAAGAGGLNALLKGHFNRERPSVVPRLVEVLSESFPSGHAMASAAIYLSMAVLLAGITRRRIDRIYILSVAVLLTLLVGVSRVYLGVHYPTDVLAGWAAGIVWALICWLIVRFAPRLLATGST